MKRGYTGKATAGRPRAWSKPQTMFAHWTAWPAAPLHKLSMAPKHTMARPFAAKVAETCAFTVPVTLEVFGDVPAGSTVTRGLFA